MAYNGIMVLREVVWVTFEGPVPFSPWFPGQTGLPSPRRTCHDAPMAKLKRLLDLYRFPGFVPRPKVRGIFGDPRARDPSSLSRTGCRTWSFASFLAPQAARFM